MLPNIAPALIVQATIQFAIAILAVGAIKKRPVVLETPEGDAIVIRHMMYISLSYDHRIVDGSLGATFCSAVARELENFAADREF